MAEIPSGIVVDDVVGFVEARADLLEIIGGQADVCGEYVIFRIVEMEPLGGLGQRRDPPGEGVAHAGVADLRTEGDEGFVPDGGGVVQEGVVAEQRTETVRADEVVVLCAHLFQDVVARLALEALVAHPLRHHARRPADFVRHLEQAALAREQIAYAVDDAAGEQLGEGFGVGGGVERRLLEQAVVLEEIAGDCALKFGIPCDEAVANGLAPGTFEVWIKVAMVYAMNA